MPPPPPTAALLPQSFLSKRRKILTQLSIPEDQYDDLSPKGSIDAGIRDLIDEINALEGYVTTSSCGGRVSVFLEGSKKASERLGDDDDDDDVLRDANAAERAVGAVKSAGVGGKGGGGRWLYVSHDPVAMQQGEHAYSALLGLEEPRESFSGNEYSESAMDPHGRFVHFKFEPMILHVLTASLNHAQILLSAALQAGFRESGALNLTPAASGEPATPMVAVRSMGLAMESIVGYLHGSRAVAIDPESKLKTLVEIANQRFVENTARIERFRALLKELLRQEAKDGEEKPRKGQDGAEWEDAEARRERKRAEGLLKAAAVRKEREARIVGTTEPKEVFTEL